MRSPSHVASNPCNRRGSQCWHFVYCSLLQAPEGVVILRHAPCEPAGKGANYHLENKGAMTYARPPHDTSLVSLFKLLRNFIKFNAASNIDVKGACQ